MSKVSPFQHVSLAATFSLTVSLSLSLPSDPLRYSIGGSKDEWAAAEAQVAAKLAGGKATASSTVSVKNPNSTKGLKRKGPEGGADEGANKANGKKQKKDKKQKKH